MIQLPSNKITPHFQLLPRSKVDQSYLRIHEVATAFTVTIKFNNKIDVYVESIWTRKP